MKFGLSFPNHSAFYNIQLWHRSWWARVVLEFDRASQTGNFGGYQPTVLELKTRDSRVVL